jgi:hypothetical protein
MSEKLLRFVPEGMTLLLSALAVGFARKLKGIRRSLEKFYLLTGSGSHKGKAGFPM